MSIMNKVLLSVLSNDISCCVSSFRFYYIHFLVRRWTKRYSFIKSSKQKARNISINNALTWVKVTEDVGFGKAEVKIQN